MWSQLPTGTDVGFWFKFNTIGTLGQVIWIFIFLYSRMSTMSKSAWIFPDFVVIFFCWPGSYYVCWHQCHFIPSMSPYCTVNKMDFKSSKFLKKISHFWWFFKVEHAKGTVELWKIIKYSKNLAKNEEKPCSTCL